MTVRRIPWTCAGDRPSWLRRADRRGVCAPRPPLRHCQPARLLEKDSAGRAQPAAAKSFAHAQTGVHRSPRRRAPWTDGLLGAHQRGPASDVSPDCGAPTSRRASPCEAAVVCNAVDVERLRRQAPRAGSIRDQLSARESSAQLLRRIPRDKRPDLLYEAWSRIVARVDRRRSSSPRDATDYQEVDDPGQPHQGTGESRRPRRSPLLRRSTRVENTSRRSTCLCCRQYARPSMRFEAISRGCRASRRVSPLDRRTIDHGVNGPGGA